MYKSLLTLLFCGAPLSAQEATSSERLDLRSFRIISERNIFDPNRSNRAERPQRREREPERRVQTDSISLVGTMSYDKGWFAFFDGSNPEYRKALQPNETIAGYTIAEIAPNFVKLASTNSQPVELSVGMQLKRQDEGPWQLNHSAENAGTPKTNSTEETSTAAAAPGEESDIIKRLMQKREQELQK